MSITLSNDVTVTLTVVENAPTTLSGTYTIGASDNGDTDLTIAQYTALTAVDISGNALSTTPAIGEIYWLWRSQHCCRYTQHQKLR